MTYIIQVGNVQLESVRIQTILNKYFMVINLRCDLVQVGNVHLRLFWFNNALRLVPGNELTILITVQIISDFRVLCGDSFLDHAIHGCGNCVRSDIV